MVAWLLVACACGLDRLVGDPHRWLHPVQVMGWVITDLRRLGEAWAGDRPAALRLAGVLITLVLVGGSAATALAVEHLALALPGLGLPLMMIGLASALAGRSLEQAVEGVLAALDGDDLEQARERLGWIVGRDVEGLPEAEILRGAAETASENAVDGLFAPLFWMLLGGLLWPLGGPGPLALAWSFKATSTLDSMLGYRRGRLRWLGTAGARLDDGLTWLPCRLVALGLGLLAGQPIKRLQQALADGASDPSPNAGVSQAAYAHALGLRLGGANRYGGQWVDKPVVGAGLAPVTAAGVRSLLGRSRQLEALWLGISLGVALAATLALPMAPGA
ncbi:adenosylcobinamide-phosphate synthase CbiB [Cyanobium sp. Morenito 9A2]|uniref:adenosylcobinamide-phosphate synthase CbiB n=1 Tax=Cyanobium sp. Morenito 9A2 TaxID=2823718 RepID=UPI0020CDA54C|nr:adenosylcobinamide-phosphate synthase CbiB [Cyanobium sp. Morenito 9A2]MCP9848213.1 cobalamin biosynthesis protein CobD [Cyanobium sp. Morenito 9A2]